jgi:hypothetical protein
LFQGQYILILASNFGICLSVKVEVEEPGQNECEMTQKLHDTTPNTMTHLILSFTPPAKKVC